jgi:hypothetical protein
MSVTGYESELRRGLPEAVEKLSRIDGFVLYAFNVWTDPRAGVTEFSAETRGNSDRFVREFRQWQQAEVRRLRAAGRHDLAGLLALPRARTDNPADFEHRGIVRITHSDWDKVVAGLDAWDVVEQALARLRGEAAALIARTLPADPDAEVSIGTRKDWHDRPLRLREK